MNTPLFFISGLPRSGSTLFVNLLGQNPAHHVGPTSGLIHLVRSVQTRWPKCQEFRAQGLENAKPYVLRGLRGLIEGFYESQFAEGKTVFDKSRGWVQYVELVESILEREIRLIVMIRDVRSIAASWEKLFRRRGIEFKTPRGTSTAMDTVTARAERILSPKQVVGRSLNRVRDCLARCPDRLVLVPYIEFTTNPVRAMADVHSALGLPAFDYDPDHVEQITHEDDNHLGADLHTIRPKIAPQSPTPWKDILPEEVAEKIAEEYADLNKLAAGRVFWTKQ